MSGEAASLDGQLDQLIHIHQQLLIESRVNKLTEEQAKHEQLNSSESQIAGFAVPIHSAMIESAELNHRRANRSFIANAIDAGVRRIKDTQLPPAVEIYCETPKELRGFFDYNELEIRSQLFGVSEYPYGTETRKTGFRLSVNGARRYANTDSDLFNSKLVISRVVQEGDKEVSDPIYTISTQPDLIDSYADPDPVEQKTFEEKYNIIRQRFKELEMDDTISKVDKHAELINFVREIGNPDEPHRPYIGKIEVPIGTVKVINRMGNVEDSEVELHALGLLRQANIELGFNL